MTSLGRLGFGYSGRDVRSLRHDGAVDLPFDPDQIDPLDPDLFAESAARAAGWQYLSLRLPTAPGSDLLEQIGRALQDCAEDHDHGWSLQPSASVSVVLGIRGSNRRAVAEQIRYLEDELLAVAPEAEIEDGAP